jgi:hypothetical protein
MKLADQIEVMRRNMVEEHQFQMNQLDHLQKRLVADHPDVMHKIAEITALQAMQGTEVIQALLRVASRIGHVPSPEQIEFAQQQTRPAAPPPPSAGHQTPLGPPPIPRGQRQAAREEMDRVIARADVEAVH